MPASRKTAESSLWKWLRDKTSRLRDLHMCRVENASEVGYPDVEGCWAKEGFHIELKCCARPAKPDTKLDLKHIKREQCLWARRRMEVGGRAFFLIQVGSNHEARRYLVPGGGKPFAVMNGVTEAKLLELSVLDPLADAEQILAFVTSYQPRVRTVRAPGTIHVPREDP